MTRIVTEPSRLQAARAWHVDVAEFLLHRHANVDAKDYLGRTPLHVAAAVDYPEMVQLLIDYNGERSYILYILHTGTCNILHDTYMC